MILNKKWTLLITAASLVSTAGLLQACGNDVDCNAGANVGSYNQGKQDGTAAGNTAGAALTYTQGKQDGYPVGNSQGYSAGYYSPQGNAAGRTAGYNDGRAMGATDIVSCSNGSTDGAADGYEDGFVLGNSDGYEDGYTDGYNAGFPVGQYSCAPGRGNAADDQNTCKARGYSEQYQVAYNTAKAANVEYQRGVKDGSGQGYADGFGPGVTAGYNDGYTAGRVTGLADGRGVAYTNCYNLAYQNGAQDNFGRISGGKTIGYNEGYLDPMAGYGRRPVAPSVSNGTGGQGDGFFDGYTDGSIATCGRASKTLASSGSGGSSKRFGFGSAESMTAGTFLKAFSAKDGIVLRTIVSKPGKLMSKEENATFGVKLQTIRTSLHEQNKMAW